MRGRSRDRGRIGVRRGGTGPGARSGKRSRRGERKNKGLERDAPLDGAEQEAQLALSRGFGVLLLRPVPAYAVKMGKVSSEVRWDGRSAVRAQIFKRTDMWRVPRGSKSGLKWGRGRTSLASARR